MTRHASKKLSGLKKSLAWALTLAFSVSALVAAQATNTYNLGTNPFGSLSFVKGAEKKGSNALSSVLTQPTTGSTAGADIGENIAAGDYVDYYEIATIGGVQVDARVTFVSENGSEGQTGQDGLLAKLDDATSTTSENPRIGVEADWNIASGQERYVEFRIQFFRNLDGLQGTPVSVTLQNIYLSIYDIDNAQFVEISGFNNYYLSATGSILSETTPGGILRLTSQDKDTSSGESSDFPTPNANSDVTFGRASFEFNSASTITLRLGQLANKVSTRAVYDLDFGPGSNWTGSSRGNAVANSVAANKSVTFLANGGSGSLATQFASTSTALSNNSLTRTGYTFSGWNTAADGSGTGFANGATYNFSADLTLYAQWTLVAVSKTVTFDANGGTGNMSAQSASTSSALNANTFTKSGSTFAGWNTSADGSGTSYADGASFPFSADTTLYAQWGNPPAPAPYSGPIPVQLSPSVKPAGETMATVLTGERLSGITRAEVDGKPITINSARENSVSLNLPALAAGTYDVTYFFGNARVVHQAALVVRAGVASLAPSKTPFTITQRFTGYRGDRGPVVARDLRAITAFINANPGLTAVTCTGSTSGIPAKSTDQALATARATNACNIVKRLVPGVTTSISTITGQGVGQFHRAVIITGQGIRP